MHCKPLAQWMRLCLAGVVSAAVLASASAPPAYGHGIFKKTLEKKYENLRVTCNMCHVKKKGKEERNPFGQLFFTELKGQDLSAKWKSVEGDERKAMESDVMAPAILVALKKIEEKENDDGQKYGDLLPAGEIEGSKLKSQ